MSSECWIYFAGNAKRVHLVLAIKDHGDMHPIYIDAFMRKRSFQACGKRPDVKVRTIDLLQQVAGTESQKIKEVGNKHFAKREYQRALEAYDRALKVADSQTDNPLLHSNKAACYMMLQR